MPGLALDRLSFVGVRPSAFVLVVFGKFFG